MFERFTQDARRVVVEAQEEAIGLHHGWIGTEHLLLSLLRQSSPTTAVLARHGLTHAAVTASVVGYVGSGGLDAEALGALGIDLDAVRSTVEAKFGPGALDADRPTCRSAPGGHIPFSPRAKKVLELSLRETIALKQKEIADGHIALGLIREGDGMAAKVLHDLGVDIQALRRDVRTALLS